MEKIKKWLADNGDGYGDGSGYGSGSGSGSGDGYGYGYKVEQINGNPVFIVDGVKTIITRVHGAVAKGSILNENFTLTPCFVVKGHGYFAHGKTLKEATQALHKKTFENMDSDEAIAAFMDKFKKGEKYKGTDFFEWHHYLTGSCLMGRESFVRNKGVNLEDSFTVEEFIGLTENDYGGEIIRELKERWNE